MFFTTGRQKEIAHQIIAGGFRDGEGYYLTDRVRSGVWVSDRPLDENEGARGNAVLRIELAQGESELASLEWIEDGKGLREWLIPATLIKEFGTWRYTRLTPSRIFRPQIPAMR